MVCGCGGDTRETEAEATTPAAGAVQAETIVAVGDSLTAGYGLAETSAYPALLEKKLMLNNYPYKVINAGISGETSSGTLSRLEWVTGTLSPGIVILETGANDGLRGIDPALTRRNIDAILTSLKQRGIVVLLAGMQLPPNLGPEYTRSFSRIYPELAKKHKVILIPFFLKDVAGESGLNQSDGIHPTARGYEKVVETIYPYVLQAITEFEDGSGRTTKP
ncbi:MAG: arylesterase [Desulfobacteraceae bacterium]|nr:arylesterase [Desulfobacteraceae bacterium]